MHVEKQEWIRAALRGGAAGAAMLHAEQIVTSAAFFDVCRSNGCGNFGRCWMCPPTLGDIHQLIRQLHSYREGLIYQTISRIEDSFDVEGMLAAGMRHAKVSQRIEQLLCPMMPAGHLHLSCGGCRLCARCAKVDDQPCRHPEQAMPSMEGYGIDVYQTVRGTGLRYVNGQNTVTYFGIVLF